MSYRNQVVRDLDRADRWAELDVLGRLVDSVEHLDEFGFFWHRVSAWAQRYAGNGSGRRRIGNGELAQALATYITLRGDWDGQLQGLCGGGQADQPAFALSGAPVRHARPRGHQEPARSQPRPSGAGDLWPR